MNEHSVIIEDIKYGIAHNLITTGIEKFLTSEQWKVFRKLRQPLPTSLPSSTPDDIEKPFDFENDF